MDGWAFECGLKVLAGHGAVFERSFLFGVSYLSDCRYRDASVHEKKGMVDGEMGACFSEPDSFVDFSLLWSGYRPLDRSPVVNVQYNPKHVS